LTQNTLLIKEKLKNIHNLDDEQLKIRQIHHIDLSKEQPSDAKHYKEQEDPSLVRLDHANIGPLKEGWMDSLKEKHYLCVYKLITVKFQVFGFQTKMESFMIDFEHQILLRFFRLVYCNCAQWWDMSMEEIEHFEKQVNLKMEIKLKEIRGEPTEELKQRLLELENTKIEPKKKTKKKKSKKNKSKKDLNEDDDDEEEPEKTKK